jgi:hypothetical protein
MDFSTPKYAIENFNINQYLIFGIFTCIIMAIFLFLFVVISRKRKILKSQKIYKIQEQAQILLSEIIFEEELNEESKLLEKQILNSNFKSQIFKSEIVRLHKSLQGELSLKLEEYFKIKKMHISSLKKIKSNKKYISIEGLGELLEMNIVRAVNDIFKILQKTKDIEITNYLICTIIKLDPRFGINLLLDLKIELNDWLQISILKILEELKFSDIPECQKWMTKGNSFAIFGCRLSSYTKNTADIPFLIDLLNTKDEILKIEIIKALGIMEAEEANEILINIYLGESTKVKEEILKTLELFKKSVNLKFFIRCSIKDTHETQLLALRAINSLLNSNNIDLNTLDNNLKYLHTLNTNNKYSNVG